MAEIRRRWAHPSFLRFLRLFNVDTGSAEIVHTYESDKTFFTVDCHSASRHPPTPTPRITRFSTVSRMPVHTQR